MYLNKYLKIQLLLHDYRASEKNLVSFSSTRVGTRAIYSRFKYRTGVILLAIYPYLAGKHFYRYLYLLLIRVRKLETSYKVYGSCTFTLKRPMLGRYHGMKSRGHHSFEGADWAELGGGGRGWTGFVWAGVVDSSLVMRCKK